MAKVFGAFLIIFSIVSLYKAMENEEFAQEIAPSCIVLTMVFLIFVGVGMFFK